MGGCPSAVHGKTLLLDLGCHKHMHVDTNSVILDIPLIVLTEPMFENSTPQEALYLLV